MRHIARWDRKHNRVNDSARQKGADGVIGGICQWTRRGWSQEPVGKHRECAAHLKVDHHAHKLSAVFSPKLMYPAVLQTKLGASFFACWRCTKSKIRIRVYAR